MITCQQAIQLFDRYLDDDLSPSFQAELYAHLLHCSPCQSRLAVLEACGDVIRMDRPEPRLAPAFTDRVMAACRDDLVVRASASRRRWAVRPKVSARRTALYAMSSLAAAASVALVFWLGMPASVPFTEPVPQTVTMGIREAAPKEFRDNMTALTGRVPEGQAQAELESTPEIEALPFLEAFLKPVVEGTRHAVEGTRRSYKDVELLIRYGFAGMNERLVAEYLQKYPDVADAQSAEGRRVTDELDFLNSALLGAEPQAPLQPTPLASPPDPGHESRGAVPQDAI